MAASATQAAPELVACPPVDVTSRARTVAVGEGGASTTSRTASISPSRGTESGLVGG